jgi:hypothetical protein
MRAEFLLMCEWIALNGLQGMKRSNYQRAAQLSCRNPLALGCQSAQSRPPLPPPCCLQLHPHPGT